MSLHDAEIIAHLNMVLKNSLTAINQYFLHARLLKHQKVVRLADYEYKKSIEQMSFSDKLVERILHLGGCPTLGASPALTIGEDVCTVLASDLAIEEDASAALDAAIATCTSKNDAGSLEILRQMKKSLGDHTQFIHTQLNLIDSSDLKHYLQTQS